VNDVQETRIYLNTRVHVNLALEREENKKMIIRVARGGVLFYVTFDSNLREKRVYNRYVRSSIAVSIHVGHFFRIPKYVYTFTKKTIYAEICLETIVY